MSTNIGKGHRPVHATRETVRIYVRTLSGAFGRVRSRGWAWMRYQIRETWREMKRAAHPPVKVRAHGRNVLAISTDPGYAAGGLLLLPLSGNSGAVGAGWVRPSTVGGAYEVEVWTEAGGPGARRVWSVGAFPDKETAQYAVELIRKPLTGGTWGKWIVRLFLLWLALILVRTWFDQEAAAATGRDAAVAGSVQAAPSALAGNAALMGLFAGGQESTAGTSAALMSALKGDAVTAGADMSLADEIYSEAIAKAKASMREQGPPQSPAPDTGLKSFGLSGGASGAGCDPKLAFKVSP